MIFFGTRGRVIHGELIEGLLCPCCDNKYFKTFGVLRYFHFYWVPTFITSKKVGVECTHCKLTLMDKEIPRALGNKIMSYVYKRSNTLPMYTGSILLLIFILWLSISL